MIRRKNRMNRKPKISRAVIALLIVLFALPSQGCATDEERRAATTGAIIGAGAGAVIGGSEGKEGREVGALIGAATGATIGLLYNKAKKKEEEKALKKKSDKPDKNGYFRNPKKAPEKRFCSGKWEWDKKEKFWVCMQKKVKGSL